MLNNIYFKVFYIEGYKNLIVDFIFWKWWEKFWIFVLEVDVYLFVDNLRRLDCIWVEIEYLIFSFLVFNLKLVNLNDLNVFNNFWN